MNIQTRTVVRHAWSILGRVRQAGKRVLRQPGIDASKRPYPLAATLASVRSNLAEAALPIATGQTKSDYLEVAEGIGRFFAGFQAADGSILDPVFKREIQYSTPCYALVAATLVKHGRAPELFDSACNALECSLRELVEQRAADRHGDFFCFPSVLAFEILAPLVSQEKRQEWERLFRAIDPVCAFKDVHTLRNHEVHNWNLIAAVGEFLRSQHGFTDTGFLEYYLDVQKEHFTPEGMYLDPYVPMIYDLFPRYFLNVMLARGYAGKQAADLEILLDRGAHTSLLMQSSCGELPTGGRSKQHNWGCALQCATFELWAKRKHAEGDEVMARAFKRAARLALQSVQRWVRPTGELWIVKNRIEPEKRHGFEGYSYHANYNLLAASILICAHDLADDTIPEGPTPCEVGGYAFALPDFHKIIANAGGHYLALETQADKYYDSTGLIRVHKAGVEPLVGPSDCSASEVKPLAIGIAWKENGEWQSVPQLAQPGILTTSLQIQEARADSVRFSVKYTIARATPVEVTEQYDLTPETLRVTAEVEPATQQIKVRFPAFCSDGVSTSVIEIQSDTATVAWNGSTQRFQAVEPAGIQLVRLGESIPTRNGFIDILEGEASGNRMVYTLTLT